MIHLSITSFATLISSVLLAQPPSYIPTTGLVAWFPFNGNALDESGSGHDLTVNGATLTTDRNGQGNAAYYFDGGGAHMNGGSHTDFEITGDRTISAWVNVGTTLNNDQGIVGYIGSSGALAGHAGYYLKRRFVDPDMIGAYEDSAQFGSGNYGAAWSDAPCAPGQWHHLVHLRSGGITYLWVDGVQQTNTYQLIPYFLNSELLVGWSGSAGQYFHGDIDDIGIWDRALTPSEIQDVFNAGGPNDCLMAAYSFDGNANDTTGNGHDGVVLGGAIPAPDRFGNANSAYQFDGVDDWVRLGGTFNGNTGTVSAWINMTDMTTLNPVFSGRDTTMNGIAVEMTVDPNSGPDASRLSYGLDQRDCVGGGCNVFFEIGDPQLTPNAWHHVVMTSDGSEVILYLDCVPITTYFGSCGDGGGLWFDDLCQDVVFMLGRHKRPLSEHFFTGLIDDVRIYNCALDSAEIAGMCDFTAGTIAQHIEASLVPYPNPCHDVLQVNATGHYEVRDMAGRLMITGNLNGSSPTIPTSDLPVGIYSLRINGDQGPVAVRFMKF